MGQIVQPVVHNLEANTSPQGFSVIGASIPATLWVRPAGGIWTVEYSVDNGANFQTLTALNGAAAYKETQVNAGFTHLRITSTTNDGGTWGIV